MTTASQPDPPHRSPTRAATGEAATTIPPQQTLSQAPLPLTLQSGARPLPDYQLVRLLGRGGFGEVWEAVGPGGFAVALKFIRLGDRAGQVEMRALEVMKNLRHPHLLALFGAWEQNGFLIIAMELAERTLLQRWQQAADQHRAGIPHPELLEYLREAAKAIDFLNEPRHASADGRLVGVQHRDIKPHNLLLVGGSLKVGDFGLAKLLEHTSVSASGAMTPAYAAPEFFAHKATRWSDQYSLAVTYCQLRGGRLPYLGSPAEIMAGHLTRPPDLTMLPQHERGVVGRALAKEPEQRWPDCRSFVEALTAVPAPQPQVTTVSYCPASDAPASRPPRPWSRLILLAVIVGVILLGGMFGEALWRQRGAAPKKNEAVPPDHPRHLDPVPSELEVLPWIRQLGGEIDRDKDNPAQPVVHVNLRKTSVRGENLSLLRGLPELRALELGSTRINNASLVHLAALTQLYELQLDSCEEIDDAGMAQLAGLTGLRRLVLSYTAIGDDGLKHLQGLTQLEDLDLSVSRVSDEGLQFLAGMTHLQELGLTGCKNLDGHGLTHLRSCPIRKLSLSYSERIAGKGLAGLGDWKHLEMLNLSHSNVGDIELLLMHRLKTLRRLDLSVTRGSEEGVRQLQKAIPQLVIER